VQTWAATLKNCATTPKRYRLDRQSTPNNPRVPPSCGPASGNSSTIGGAFWLAIATAISSSTKPSPR
jgi:hypothetical protein